MGGRRTSVVYLQQDYGVTAIRLLPNGECHTIFYAGTASHAFSQRWVDGAEDCRVYLVIREGETGGVAHWECALTLHSQRNLEQGSQHAFAIDANSSGGWEEARAATLIISAGIN